MCLSHTNKFVAHPAANFPFTFVVEPDPTNNLTSTSVALVFQLRAIDKKRLKSKIGCLNADDMKILLQNLENILKI